MPILSSNEGVHPAPPVLASTLLDLESDHRKATSWAEPFQTGVKRLDSNLPQTLWMGGKVIGIVSDRAESMLAEHLIATHLGTLTSSATGDDCNKPSTFVIAPPNTSIASTIHALLQTRLANRSEKNRVQLLDTIHIMQYLDFAGLAECFSEVSTCLHNLNGGSATLSTSHGRASPQIQRQVLLVDGLCPALESTQRRSGLVQANALSASLLQSITHFSRSYPWLLVLFSLEASGHARGSEELTSAFSSPGKSFCGVSPGGMLQRTLLAGIDTVVLVHDRLDAGLKDGDLVVEVVKDRVGASLGQWVVWPKPG